MADWSELHDDLLVLVARRLNLIEDYLCFASVCKSWQCAATKHNFNSELARVPWLMLAEEEGNPCRQFFIPYNGMIRKKSIPKSIGKKCMESMGWLFTVGKDEGDISLLHPFSGVEIELPHQNTTENYDEHSVLYPWSFFLKAVLSASPSQTNDYVVMVIEGNMRFLSYWRPGDLTWTRIRTENSGHVHDDVIYFDGKFYAIDGTGHIVIWDIAGPDPSRTEVVAKLPSKYIRDELYLVESLGSILVVVRDGCMIRELTDDSERIPLTRIQEPEIIYDCDSGDSDDEEDVDEVELTYGTTNFQVFELDLMTGKLKETKDIGNTALFIGHNASRSVQASQFPGIKPNHIYFTDDYDLTYTSYEEGGGLDMGVYNLLDGTIVPHYNGASLNRICPPTWVTPTLY